MGSKNMREIGKYLGFLVAVTALSGCGSDSSGDATGGSGGKSSSGGAGTSGGSSSTGGSTGGSGTGTGGGGTFTQDGVCVVSHRSTATKTTMEGYEEYVLTTADGNDTKLCVVRFDVKRVGPAAMPAGCKTAAMLPDNEDCLWTNEIQYSNPVTMLDTDGVCAKSQLGMTADKIASINGSKTTYGFAPEAAGHASLAMRYDGTKWDLFVNGTWDPETNMFRFDQKDRCAY